MSNRYANVEQIFKHIDTDKLLVGNNAEWAREAVCKADYIDLDYFVPIKEIDDAIKYCREKIEWYRSLGSIAHMECYNNFIDILKSMSMEADEE